MLGENRSRIFDESKTLNARGRAGRPVRCFRASPLILAVGLFQRLPLLGREAGFALVGDLLQNPIDLRIEVRMPAALRRECEFASGASSGTAT